MTHTLHRTSNADKMYNLDTLNHDIVFLAMSAKGYSNDKGSAPKMVKILEIAKKHNPVNYGDMRTGNLFSADWDDILKRVADTSIVHAVYTNLDDAVAFAKEVREANLGISLVVSSPFDICWQVAEKSGAMGHTIEFSGGIWGKTSYLPAPEVLDCCTMCGHGMISRYLVEECIKRVKAGKMTGKNAAAEICKQCCCGIANPVRMEAIVKAAAGKK
jgi:hypothetical protein